MCSIIGYIGANLSEEEVRSYFERTVSRGPDMTRILNLGNGFLGFHRLAIMGLNESGMQPFSAFGNSVVCNGELYGFRLLKKKLEAAVARCDCNAGELYYNRTTHQLGEQEIDQLLDAILLDCQEGTMAQGMLFHQDYGYDSICFYFPSYDGNGERYTLTDTITVYPDSKHTMQFLTDHGFHTPHQESTTP